jgi:hypothetical protein
MASLGERRRTSRPSTRIAPAWIGSAPKIARATSVRPAPDQPGQAQDLAFPDRDRDVVQDDGVRVAGVAAAAEAPDLQRHLAPGAGPAPGEEAVHLAADHHADDGVDGDVGDLGRADEAAVAQHREPVAERHHLVEPVGDEARPRCRGP